MGEAYFNLKRKLEDLGYSNSLPVDAVPLVECILADLLQTTRSLQHYMDLSKEALMQRDSLMLEAEPYKCDNAKLIQENNQLHREVLKLKEENLRLSKEGKRKIKMLSEELAKKEVIVSKLQHDVRDLSLRGLCADTLSSRNKSKRRDGGDTQTSKVCICSDKKPWDLDKDVMELNQKIQLLEEKNEAYNDEVFLLKNQVENRDHEIVRLNILLEGGRSLSAVNKDCCHLNSDGKMQHLLKEIREMETSNELLKKEIEIGLEKQHEAMLRALSLADKNKALQDELQKVDTLALKVEDDCNKRLAAMMNEVNFLQTRIEGLTLKNMELEKEMSQQMLRGSSSGAQKIQELLSGTIKEKEALQREITDLVELNKSLQEKIITLSHISKTASSENIDYRSKDKKCPSKEELLVILDNDRKKYEKHMIDIQDKLSETMSLFNKHLGKCKDKESLRFNSFNDSSYVRDLQNRLCESDQKMLMLKKENEDLKSKMHKSDEGNRQNYKDVISQLNAENTELSKENISLSQQLSQCRSLQSAKLNERGDYGRSDIQKLKAKVDELTYEIQIVNKDKQEYKLRYKEAMETVEKLKGDLAFKQREMEQLQEENVSYKMTHRNGKASVDHLKEECNFLREQIKRMQSDVIKEKTLANQIKNIQLETERSSSEVQNELLSTQKKLCLSKDTIDALEKRCNDLQSEILSLKSDKSNLIDNIRKVDQERDKLVIELDHKTETVSVLEQKLKSQSYEVNKLENEIAELKRKLNVNKVSEHKLSDYESQIAFLNGEILRLTQQLDSSVIENKHLQNSLADTNGTLRLTRIEYDKSRKEVDSLKQQLQHYVAEVRRIEEMLSQKEAERSDMLEQFASLSVEANILENTNHSLESESASKSQQLQSYISKIQSLEAKLMDKESIIENQSARVSAMTCKISSLENEIKLMAEEKIILEQNLTYLKQMCNNLQTENASNSRCAGETDSELKLYENRIKSLSNSKAKLEVEKEEMKENLMTTERLLSNARQEIVELKLALQDATSETKSLQDHVNKLSRKEADIHEATMTRELELPLMLEETIHEVSHEEDDDSLRFHEVHKRFSKYSHSGTI
ncbi:centrosomal protein of 135 kDa [Ostrinia nubilalis]|uniref:centrosomal protein of 135 kDa n=1 Tax=Ostrinia nubilalis TaxID=29057 RepID=UPI0030822ABA